MPSRKNRPNQRQTLLWQPDAGQNRGSEHPANSSGVAAGQSSPKIAVPGAEAPHVQSLAADESTAVLQCAKLKSVVTLLKVPASKGLPTTIRQGGMAAAISLSDLLHHTAFIAMHGCGERSRNAADSPRRKTSKSKVLGVQDFLALDAIAQRKAQTLKCLDGVLVGDHCGPSRAVKKLKLRGLVKSEPNCHGRSRLTISITPKGRLVAREMEKRIYAALGREMGDRREQIVKTLCELHDLIGLPATGRSPSTSMLEPVPHISR